MISNHGYGVWLLGQERVTLKLFDRPGEVFGFNVFETRLVEMNDAGIWYENDDPAVRFFSPWANVAYVGATRLPVAREKEDPNGG